MGISSQRRLSQRDILPTSIKNRLLPTDIIKLSETETLGPITVNPGFTVTLTSTISSEKVLVGDAGYMVAFFENSITTGNWIPFGSGITPADWDIVGPLVAPPFSPGGSSHKEGFLVIKTAISNKSTSAKTLYIIVGGRFVFGIGAPVSSD